MTKGLQIVYTPWRTHNELLQVRSWLYPEQTRLESYAFAVTEGTENGESQVRRKHMRKACDEISAWKLRPPLPHAIESTWLLTEALLADSPACTPSKTTISVFSLRAGYITALTRFVTALLDSSQTSKFKVSMYTKAAELGLPAMFVDLRHEATHGEMPSLRVLREACQRALQWLWDHHWRDLGDGERDGEENMVPNEAVGEREMMEVAEQEGEVVEAWETRKGSWRSKGIGIV